MISIHVYASTLLIDRRLVNFSELSVFAFVFRGHIRKLRQDQLLIKCLKFDWTTIV